MPETTDVWKVLSVIRAASDGNLSEEGLRVGAYFVWQKRNKKGGSPPSDDNWFANLQTIRQEREHWLLGRGIRDAVTRNEPETAVGLSVVGKLAAFLHMRPTDICPDTPIYLERWESELISAAVGHDFGTSFLDLGPRSTASSFIRFFWMQYEVKVEQEKAKAKKTV